MIKDRPELIKHHLTEAANLISEEITDSSQRITIGLLLNIFNKTNAIVDDYKNVVKHINKDYKQFEMDV